ncbi:hypothetical protein F5Y13DRAFT_151386 [Hypoxylon sp. FL1857]|nr:hypothetical protein F5Y13DRAFT_151386 [Hypoxylon sp. FL1857]
MPPTNYTPILPALPPGQDPESFSRSASKRPSVNIACESCRKSKSRCDGARPACSTCVKRGRACIYSERRDAASSATELVELLKSLPEDQALGLLASLREKGDATSVLSEFKGMPDASGRVRPDIESELKAKYKNAYPPLEHIVPSVLAASNLLKSDFGVISSDKDVHHDIQQTQVGRSDIDRNMASPIDIDSAVSHFRSPLSSGQGPDYFDNRLRGLKIGFWTDIEITDEFAAQVISLYLRTDHPLLGLFDPDVFITDLVSQQASFCSRFLLHSLMYLGCQMYSAFDKSASKLAREFSQEAERLWEVERTRDSYLTMAGAVLLSLSLMGNGKDHAVLTYAKEAAEMGIRLGLFDDEAAGKRIEVEQSKEQKTASCYAAWSVFNWKTLVSLFYRQPGSGGPMILPRVPIPGNQSFTAQDAPIPQTTSSVGEALLGNTFPALCNFWRIIHGALWIYYPGADSPPDRFKLDIAENKFRELITWAGFLPSFLLRRKDSPHHVAVFHIWFHAAVLDIFRPFIKKPAGERPRLKTFSAWDSSPDAVFSASVNQLKRLIVDYRTNYETSAYSILWHTGLLYLANAMLENGEDPQTRLYFLLCVYGYERLKRPYRISRMIVQGLLAMMLRDTDMSSEEARKIMEDLGEGGWDRVTKEVDEKIRATFMVDLNLAVDNPEQASVENMADQFENMALFQDFLNRDKMEM